MTNSDPIAALDGKTISYTCDASNRRAANAGLAHQSDHARVRYAAHKEESE